MSTLTETFEIILISILFVLLCCQTIDKEEKLEQLNQEIRDKDSIIESLDDLVLDLTYQLEEYDALPEEEQP